MITDNMYLIQRIINLYGVAVDSQNWSLFDEIFTPDIDALYNENARWSDRATIKSDFEAYHDLFDGTQHMMSNHVIDVDGDTAQALTYAHWRLIRKGLPGGEFWEGNGWYDDTLVRTPNGWRINRRVCKIIWWGGNPLVNETTPGVKFDLPLTSLRSEAAAGAVAYFRTRPGLTG